MSFFQWLRASSKTRASRQNRRTPSRPPRFDLLEDRLAPATLTVNSLDDGIAPDAALTLREALAAVNVGGTAGFSDAELAQISGTFGSTDTIQFNLAGGSTITLQPALGSLTVSKAVVINGPGANLLTVDGDGTHTIFDCNPASTSIIVLKGLTITGGDATSISGATNPLGGAIRNGANSALFVDACAINTNDADMGGAIANEGSFQLTNSTIFDNFGMFGGGIYNTGSLSAYNSTFSTNQAEFGAGIYLQSGDMTINNSTFAENMQFFSGGGIFTIGGTATLNNTLLANPTSDIEGSVTVTGHNNLIANSPTAGGLVEGQDGNLVNTFDGDPALNTYMHPSLIVGPLADNGGPTLTHALLPGSRAFDKGDNQYTPEGVTTDQRGEARNALNGLDIGAYEFPAPTGDLVVDTGADGVDYDFSAGKLTLREAVMIANTRAGDDTITFAASAPTVTLTDGELVLSGSDKTTIDGGTNGVTIQRSFDTGTPEFRLIYSSGIVELRALTLTNGLLDGAMGAYGAGIFSSGTLTIIDSTLSGNSGAEYGGAVFNYSGRATIVNSTISGNSADKGGGIVHSSNQTTVTNSTITRNSVTSSGGGIFAFLGGNVLLNNTIVAGNFKTIPLVPGNLTGTAPDDLFQTGSTPFQVENSLIGSDDHPLVGILDPNLKDNGGPTKTHALVAGSPAINAGSNALAVDNGVALIKDQRGQPRFVSTTVDIGAVEYSASSLFTPPHVWNDYDPAHAFLLHSKPGSNRIIYLDFDGHTVDNSGWNDILQSPFNVTGWTLGGAEGDGDAAAFNDAERNKIIEMWRKIAEDFAPFDIDVTTEDPGLENLLFSGGNDTTWGARVVIGRDPGGFGSSIANFGTFKSANDANAFVFNGWSTQNPYEIADTVSHEVGHLLGLNHDGDARNPPENENQGNYYSGHGSGNTSWQPLMGDNVAGKSVTQWSKGEYNFSNNPEDDLAIISNNSKGVTYRQDDYDVATPVPLRTDGTPTHGVIERNTDIDKFSFYANAAAAVTITIDPMTVFGGSYANLDIQAILKDSAGNELQSVNLPDDLNAVINFNVPANGTYFVEIDGVGHGDPATDGYSDYGSLGNYRIQISGNSAPPTPPTVVSIDDGRTIDKVLVNETLVYTVTFDLDMDHTTVTAADFTNGATTGAAAITIVAVTETSPGVFTVKVKPTSAGALALKVGANVNSAEGTPLAAAVSDADTVQVMAVTADPIVVDTGADGVDYDFSAGKLTLREAILIANIRAGADDIIFAATVSTVTLTNSILNFTDAAKTTIDGGTAGVTIARSLAAGTPKFGIVLVEGDATAELIGLTLTNGNVAFNFDIGGGGIFNSGTLTVTNSTLSSNTADLGGGIANVGTLFLNNSTLSGNSAETGGGINNFGSLTITNSTLSGNSAATLGGGIYNGNTGVLIVGNSTLTGNSVPTGIGGGIAADGTETLRNTIVAGNLSLVPNDLSGTVNTANNNLIGDAATAGGITHGGANANIVGNNGAGTLAIASILNTTLANNGGPTRTHALAANSPAKNAGLNTSIPAGVTTDQRGVTRIVGGTVDIGAVEDAPLSVTLATSSSFVTVGQTISYTVTFTNDLASLPASVFENAGTASINVASPVETSPGVFTVSVTPLTAGTVKLRIKSTANIVDVNSVPLVVPVEDDDIVRVMPSSLMVTNGGDVDDANYSDLSLREAVFLANAHPGPDTITFSAAVSTVTLTAGELVLTDTAKTTITGGTSGVTIARSSAGGTPEFRLFKVASGANAGMIALSLTNGAATGSGTSGFGGAISNLGTLSIENSTLFANSASNVGGGGAIYNLFPGTLTVVNSTLSGNIAAQGGGIMNNAGTMTLVSSTVTGNRATSSVSGALVASGTVNLVNTLIAGNFTGNLAMPGEIFGDLTSAKSTLIGTAGNYGITHGQNGNIVGVNGTGTIPIDQILETTLKDNGGPTMTHALVQNSLAIAAASADSIDIDQRNTIRDAGAADIGAYEVQQPLAPVGVPPTYAETFQPKPSADQIEAFIKGLYQSTLLREPAPVEVAAWKTNILSGADLTDVAYGFVNSVENRSSQVAFYYKYFLGREPDQAGLDGWVNQLQLGANEATVMSGFLLSVEFTGQNNDEAFVNLMYYAVLGRPAEAAGLAGWTQQLADGTSTRQQVGNGFLFSTESVTRVVQSSFSAYLKRSISPADAAGFVNQIQTGEKTFGEVAADLLGSDEFLFWAGQNVN